METDKKEVMSEDEKQASTGETNKKSERVEKVEVIDEENAEVEDVEIIDEESDEIIDTDIYDLKKELETLKEENNTLSNRLLRVQAEYENYKRRTTKERVAERKYKSQDLANELLPVLDNFERALQIEINDANKSIIEGIT